jgi:hypothetical protein
VAGSGTIGESEYKFERWIGSVGAPNDNKTTVTVDGPISLGVEWTKSKESGSIGDMWWILGAIAIIAAAIIVSGAVLLKRRKLAEEAPETVDEESLLEDILEETEIADSVEEPED